MLTGFAGRGGRADRLRGGRARGRFIGGEDGDLESVGTVLIALGGDGSGSDGEGTLLGREQSESESERERRTHLPVHKRSGLRLGRIRSGKHFKGPPVGLNEVLGLRVDGISQLEGTINNHLRRRGGSEGDVLGKEE